MQPRFDTRYGYNSNFDQSTCGTKKSDKVFCNRLRLLSSRQLFFDGFENDLFHFFLGLRISWMNFSVPWFHYISLFVGNYNKIKVLTKGDFVKRVVCLTISILCLYVYLCFCNYLFPPHIAYHHHFFYGRESVIVRKQRLWS